MEVRRGDPAVVEEGVAAPVPWEALITWTIGEDHRFLGTVIWETGVLRSTEAVAVETA